MIAQRSFAIGKPCIARANKRSHVCYAKPVEGQGKVFRVDAKDLQEVPTTSLIDGGFTVDSYFGNGTDIFTTIPLPLNSSLKKLSGVGRYDLVVPSIEFFQFKFYPQIIIVMKYAQGGPGQPGVPPIIEMTAEMCEMRGPIVEQYNDRMGFDLKVLLGTKGQKMTCEATIKVLADPPAPLDVLPKSTLEKTGSAVTQALLSTFHKALLDALAKDYQGWARDAAVREARKEAMDKVAVVA